MFIDASIAPDYLVADHPSVHVRAYGTALEPGDPWAVSERGLDFLAKADFDAAIADFNRALELTPTSAWTFAERGVAYLRSGRPAQAVEDLSRALELDEGDAWTLYARGIARTKTGDADAGSRDIAAAIKVWPDVAAAAAKDGIR